MRYFYDVFCVHKILLCTMESYTKETIHIKISIDVPTCTHIKAINI